MDLKGLIIAAQNLDEDAMNEIISKFDPIISKYTRILQNNEDYKSDIILHLIETVHSLDISKFRIPNDYAFINYISKTIYHKYIWLSKKQVSFLQKENTIGIEDPEECFGNDESSTQDIDNILLLNSMEQVLTEREYTCVKLMVIDGLSSTEAAKLLGISRQTVNENKNRGLRKLKKIFA